MGEAVEAAVLKRPREEPRLSHLVAYREHFAARPGERVIMVGGIPCTKIFATSEEFLCANLEMLEGMRVGARWGALLRATRKGGALRRTLLRSGSREHLELVAGLRLRAAKGLSRVP